MNDEEPHKTEILIIRRSHGDDHGHHGGAWKIAYADFVTAMMAFFLVMWLINSANEATRARVASYFNPIKMTDATPAGRGLNESAPATSSHSDKKAPKDSTEDKGTVVTGASAKAKGTETTPQTSENKREEKLLRDPYKLIDSVSHDGQANASGRTIEITRQKTGDPFDPQAWEALREGKQNTDVASADSKGVVPLADQIANQSAEGKGGQNEVVLAQDQRETKVNPNTQPDLKIEKIQPSLNPDVTNSQITELPNTQVVNANMSGEVNVERVRDEVLRSVAAAGATAEIGVQVKMTAEGLLIVLSDKVGRAMFEVGSAAPTSALVNVVEGVGKVLENQTGSVVVRGHTDARQYKNIKFDNWQLSTARAHLASYMLFRGGFDERRLRRIEGYGASELQNDQNPFADENRRVEFLLSR